MKWLFSDSFLFYPHELTKIVLQKFYQILWCHPFNFSALRFFKNFFSSKGSLQFFWYLIFCNRMYVRFFSKIMFCVFWALEIAPTLDVLVLFFTNFDRVKKFSLMFYVYVGMRFQRLLRRKFYCYHTFQRNKLTIVFLEDTKCSEGKCYSKNNYFEGFVQPSIILVFGQEKHKKWESKVFVFRYIAHSRWKTLVS